MNDLISVDKRGGKPQPIGKITTEVLMEKIRNNPLPLDDAGNHYDDEIELCSDDCEICRGGGHYRIPDLPVGHPEYGKLHLCPNVDKRILHSEGRFGLTRQEMRLDWSKILPLGNKSVDVAVETIQRTLERGYGWVYLWGGYGQAKTLMLKIAIADQLAQRNDAAYTRMADVIEHMRQAYDEDDPSQASERRLRLWTRLPILAVDEFDRVRNTEYATEKKFVIMDERYQAAIRQENSITLMAANVTPKELPGYMYDRVRDGRFEIVHLDGPSARPGMDERIDY